jgi:hypothetical protein
MMDRRGGDQKICIADDQPPLAKRAADVTEALSNGARHRQQSLAPEKTSQRTQGTVRVRSEVRALNQFALRHHADCQAIGREIEQRLGCV